MPGEVDSLESSRLAFSSETRYVSQLLVFGSGDPTIKNSELGADINHLKIQDFEVKYDVIGTNHSKIQDKIAAALKRLTFREQHVLIQFWSLCVVGKQQLLTTVDQPFGLGVRNVELWKYRQDSVCNTFIVDKDHEEEDRSPAARVFRRGLPEWTPDVTNYLPKHFKQQTCALCCNLHGYLALPVFNSDTRLCVGVLELLTSSNYTNYTYEVQQLCNALKTVDLRTQDAFGYPILNVPNEHRQNRLDEICSILKTVCDIHNLPLSQTWVVSQHSSFVSHEKVIEKSCSSFDTRCVRKVCMSTTALPFHVKDLRMWPFREACREQHLDQSHGFVGKALLSCGSCFCGDVTKLSEEEYPLVHNARMNRLTSCFAIFLHGVETYDDYVLEFFLSPDIKHSGQVLNLVQTLKQIIEIGSGFELGDSSCIQVVEPPTEVEKSFIIDPSTIQISSITTTNNNKFETVTSDSESIMADIANKIKSCANVSNQWQSKQIYTEDDFAQYDFYVVGASKNNNMISNPNVSKQRTSDNITDAREKNYLKQGRKNKLNSLTMESLGGSWPQLKRFCRTNNRLSWPLQHLQRPSHIQFGLSFVVFLVIRVKRWGCSVKRHGFSGKWWSCGRHRYLPSKSDCIYQAARLFMQLKRWRNKISMRNNALHNGDHPEVSESTAKPKYKMNNIIPYSCVAESIIVHESPKQNVANISDIKWVTVKAAFKDAMIKFRFPTSSGLLELEHEVTQRIKLKNKRPHLKYRDEDNDLILLACDADLHHLLGFAANHSTIKLIIMADD